MAAPGAAAAAERRATAAMAAMARFSSGTGRGNNTSGAHARVNAKLAAQAAEHNEKQKILGQLDTLYAQRGAQWPRWR